MRAEQPITVLFADDHAMVREGLAALLRNQDHIRVVGHCGDGMEVLQKVRELRPRVAVLDITMPGLNGLDACREVTRLFPQTKVLVLTMHSNEEFVVWAFQNGAMGYLLKEAAGEKLGEAIRTVARGERYLDPDLPLPPGPSLDPLQRLTPRERQVLQLIAESNTNRDIAGKLKIAVKTVDTHRQNLMKKLDVHSQTDLVRIAMRAGMVCAWSGPARTRRGRQPRGNAARSPEANHDSDSTGHRTSC